MAGVLLRQSQARAWRTDQMDSEAMDQHHLQQLWAGPRRPFHTEPQENPHRQQYRGEIFRSAGGSRPGQDGIFTDRRRRMRIRRRRELLRQQEGRTKAEFPRLHVVKPVLVPSRFVRLNGWWREDQQSWTLSRPAAPNQR